MLQLVKCPHCQELSDVEPVTLGQMVACPFCARPFRADVVTMPRSASPSVSIPVVYPVRGRVYHPEEEAFRSEPTGLLWAASLVPVVIPILWVAGLFIFKLVPIFSFALPMAMAISLVGINVGIIWSRGWTSSTKLKAVAMVGLMGLFSAACLYFLKKEWAEGFKNQLGPSNLNWQEYEPQDRSYRVKLPGRALDATSPLPDWDLKTVRTAIDGRRARGVFGAIYTVAAGTTRPEWQPLPDEDAFTKAHELFQDLGEVGGEKSLMIPFPGSDRDYPGREWVVALPDGVTNRIVRVYRVRHRGEDLFFYLAVEGAFVTPDAKYVQDFLKSFSLRPLPRR